MEYDGQRIEAIAIYDDTALEDRLKTIDAKESAALLEQSYLGRMGRPLLMARTTNEAPEIVSPAANTHGWLV